MLSATEDLDKRSLKQLHSEQNILMENYEMILNWLKEFNFKKKDLF